MTDDQSLGHTMEWRGKWDSELVDVGRILILDLDRVREFVFVCVRVV